MGAIDHRVRVAAARRERMRMRLMEAALVVFGQDGAKTCTIDEVIHHANVSRGTSYNYFHRLSKEDMWAVIAYIRAGLPRSSPQAGERPGNQDFPMQQSALDILDSNRIMTIATVRPDGWSLYFPIYPNSQKFANIKTGTAPSYFSKHRDAQSRE